MNNRSAVSLAVLNLYRCSLDVTFHYILRGHKKTFLTLELYYSSSFYDSTE
jgi:hypothetical protein